MEKEGSVRSAVSAYIHPDTLLKLNVLLDQELPFPYMFDIVHYETLEKPELKAHIDLFGKTFYSRS